MLCIISNSVLLDDTSSKQLSKTSIVQMLYVDFVPVAVLSAVPPEVIGNELILEMNKTAVKDFPVQAHLLSMLNILMNSGKWAITLRCGAFILEPGHPVLYPVVKVGFPGEKFDRAEI